MLKAIQTDYYFKNGGKVWRYLVQGPIAEIEEYKLAEAMRRNITPDKIACSGNSPIMFISEFTEIQNGNTMQTAYTLVKSFDGTRYNRDTTAQDKARSSLLENLILGEQAKIMAQARMGLDIGARANRSVATRTAPAQVAPAIDTQADDIAATIAEGDNLVEQGEQIPDIAAVGNETLGG